MGKGLPRSNKAAMRNPQAAAVIRQNIKTSVTLSFTGATGVGWATAVIGDLPVGNIALIAAAAYVKLTKLVATGIQDTFDGDLAIGSAPTADATLSGSEVDVIPSTAFAAAAVGGTTGRMRAVNGATQVMLDNTDGTLELNLNVLIDDANISADTQTVTAAVELSLVFSVLSDD